MCERNEKYSSRILQENLDHFKENKQIPRSQAKKLRDSYRTGWEQVDRYKAFLESRKRALPGGRDDGRKYWYDALEIMDISLREGDIK